jgi:four helix bundle protein
VEEIKPQKSLSYNDLKIYKAAHALAVEIHQMSLTLPRVELYEEGQQIRRAAKSISANIVEGFGRRRYKLEFIRFLVFAHASCDETIEHLRLLLETKSLDAERATHFLDEYNNLGRKLNRFIEAVEKGHKT